MLWRVLLLATMLFSPSLPTDSGMAVEDRRMVTVIWHAKYLVNGGDSRPMVGGQVIWFDRPHEKWVEATLDKRGFYKAELPLGYIIPWALNAPDDDTCWVLDPPTEHGPANMGVFYPLTTTQMIALKFWGDCKVE